LAASGLISAALLKGDAIAAFTRLFWAQERSGLAEKA
jgi:hypothetical protein